MSTSVPTGPVGGSAGPVRVHLGSDHAGFELKQALVDQLIVWGYEPVDHGPRSYDPDDDYPRFVLRAAEAVVADPGSFGIVIGGSGNGEAIAANKVRGVRAALVWSDATARLGREHNDANVISLGARQYPDADSIAFVQRFLSTSFAGGDRHVRRLALVGDYERSGDLPPLEA